MRRAKFEGQHLGRPRLNIDREALLRDCPWFQPARVGQAAPACPAPRWFVLYGSLRSQVQLE